MATKHNLGGNYWGYLIQDDKSATPLLQSLCIGLAKIIGNLEAPNAGPPGELTPQRLAHFYRSVGSNYDGLFLSTSNAGLSTMYRIIGCFHALFPTRNAFEPPAIPCLTAEGYAKWQTVQIMLCPAEAVPCLQEAVKRYDVPRPDGGHFPKHLPREAFPMEPDLDTERWHNHVTQRLSTEQQQIKNSPYPSPYDPPERHQGYFSPITRPGLPQIRQPSRPSNESSFDYDLARRRSSVPDLPSPLPDTAASGTDRYGRSSDGRKRTARSHSAQRPSHALSSRQRTSNGSGSRPSTSAHRPLNPVTPSYPTPDPFHNVSGQAQTHPQQRPHLRHRNGSHRTRSPSTIDESSGSEASSEDSVSGRHSPRNLRSQRKHSLWIPSLLNPNSSAHNHKRRHSHDASYKSHEKGPPLPPRPSQAPPSNAPTDSPNRGGPYSASSPVSAQRYPNIGINPPRFRENVFDKGDNVKPGPAPLSSNSHIGPIRPPTQQVPPPPQNTRLLMDANPSLTREHSRMGNSGENTDRTRPRAGSGRPLRVTTMSGVDGRRYPNTMEPRSAADRRAPPLPV